MFITKKLQFERAGIFYLCLKKATKELGTQKYYFSSDKGEKCARKGKSDVQSRRYLEVASR